MSLKKTALAYASVAGRLRGVISGILKYNSDEISPTIKKTLEEALEWSENELDIPE
jgi:hypothetical protein